MVSVAFLSNGFFVKSGIISVIADNAENESTDQNKNKNLKTISDFWRLDKDSENGHNE